MTIKNLTQGESFELPNEFLYYDAGFTRVSYLGEKSCFGNSFLGGRHYLFGGKSEDGQCGIVLGIPANSRTVEKEEIDFTRCAYLSLIPQTHPAINDLETLLGEKK